MGLWVTWYLTSRPERVGGELGWWRNVESPVHGLETGKHTRAVIQSVRYYCYKYVTIVILTVTIRYYCYQYVTIVIRTIPYYCYQYVTIVIRSVRYYCYLYSDNMLLLLSWQWQYVTIVILTVAIRYYCYPHIKGQTSRRHGRRIINKQVGKNTTFNSNVLFGIAWYRLPTDTRFKNFKNLILPWVFH